MSSQWHHRRVRKGSTRAAILDTALELLDAGARLTYEAVARTAGVSRQTVYAHFPTRAELLVAAVERAREVAGLDTAIESVYQAPTGRAALEALLAVHVSFVPPLMRAHVAVEQERARDPLIDAAFARRSGGRRHLAQLVTTRLHAEGDLAPPWTVATASELITTLTSGSTTAQLLREMGWTSTELHDRLLMILERSLLRTTTTQTRRD